MTLYELYGGPGDGAVMELPALTEGRVHLLVFPDARRPGWSQVHAYGVGQGLSNAGMPVMEHELLVGRQSGRKAES